MSLKIVEPANNAGLKAAYIANKSFDDSHFKKMILEYIDKFGQTKRSEIDGLIIPKLSATYTDQQKKDKVTNFLSALRMENKIESKKYATWETKI